MHQLTEVRQLRLIQTSHFKTPNAKTHVPNPNSSKPNNQNAAVIKQVHPQITQPTLDANEESDCIDFTKSQKKHIKQSTLLISSSILKGIRTNELSPDTKVRSFWILLRLQWDNPPSSYNWGPLTREWEVRVQAYDIDNCKTIILHVGGNDADNGDDVDSFCDNYIALLESLASVVRRLIVSGLLPRKKVDLGTYNDQLKSLCDENDIEFIDHYQNFLLASGEIRASYFWKDKIHLNQHGTRKFLTNTDKVCKVKR